MTISKNLASDYLATGDGVTDNATPIGNFRTFFRAQNEPVVLTIPAGEFYSTLALPFDGAGTLIVNATGATLTGAWDKLCSGAGFSQKPARTARLYTVIAEASSAFCKTPAHASRFTVGHWVAIAAQEWQGAAGYPPNFQKVEFVQVTSVNASTGEVQFTPAVTETYYDHFIDTHTPGADYDTGGPVTMFVQRDPENGTGGIATAFDIDFTMNGGTFDTAGSNSAGQIYTQGKRVVFNDVTCIDCCLIPTNARFIQYNNLTVTGLQMEVDKNVQYLEINNSNLRAIHVQSPSVMRAIYSNVNCTHFWHGTGRRAEIYGGSAPGIKVGCDGYGGCESLIMDGFDDQGFGIDWVSSQRQDAADFDLVGNVLTYNGGGILPFGAERTALFIAGKMTSNFLHVGLTQRLGTVEDDGDGFPAHTISLAELAPAFLDDGEPTYVVQHPCVDATLRNLIGAGAVYSDGPAHIPLFSYARDTGNFETQSDLTIWGRIISIRVNVTRSYTGGQANCRLHLGGQNGNIPVIHANGAAGFDFDFTINCKIAGERIITAASITGGQSGDTATPPGNIWFMNVISPKVTDNISGDTSLQKPMVTVTIETNQFVRSFVCNFV